MLRAVREATVVVEIVDEERGARDDGAGKARAGYEDAAGRIS